jgi:hypothetical protein
VPIGVGTPCRLTATTLLTRFHRVPSGQIEKPGRSSWRAVRAGSKAASRAGQQDQKPGQQQTQKPGQGGQQGGGQGGQQNQNK